MQDEVSAAAPRPSSLDPDTRTFIEAVFDAVRQGDTGSLHPLLLRGLPANLCTGKGDSLLMLASYHGRLGTAWLLLDHGADTELRNDAGQSPLQAAAFQGDLAMVELLLAREAVVDSAGPDGKTALMMAAMFNRLDIIDRLLAAGANPAARDAQGVSIPAAARLMGPWRPAHA